MMISADGEGRTAKHAESDVALPLERIDLGPGTGPEAECDVADGDAGPAGAPMGAGRIAAIVVALLIVVASAWGLGVRQRPHPASPAAPGTAPPAAVTGLAELLVTSYLTGDAAEDPVLRLLYPAAPPLPTDDAQRYVSQAVTVDAVHDADRGWAVTVAADVLTFDGRGYRRDPLHHYLVGIVETDGRPGATSLPARIGTPDPAAVPATVVGAPVDDEPLFALVHGFLTAYTCGRGDLRSFVASGSNLRPITPSPYVEVQVDLLTGVTLGPDRIHLRAVATATDEGGAEMPTEHHLSVGIEGGVWKVVSMEAGPLLATAVTDPQPDTG